jgi:hypothetical protein
MGVLINALSALACAGVMSVQVPAVMLYLLIEPSVPSNGPASAFSE